jgi:hypothetical protein
MLLRIIKQDVEVTRRVAERAEQKRDLAPVMDRMVRRMVQQLASGIARLPGASSAELWPRTSISQGAGCRSRKNRGEVNADRLSSACLASVFWFVLPV